MLPLRRITRSSLSSNLVRSLTAAPRAAPFLSHSIRRPVSTMDIVFTKDAAPPAGPYSQAIKTPTAIYCSGQIHFDPEGNLIGGTIQEKTAACIRNLKAVLVAAGSDINKVVKVNIFLNDMNDFAAMNEEYAKWFTHKPARSCVAVKTLPKNADVELEAIALP